MGLRYPFLCEYTAINAMTELLVLIRQSNESTTCKFHQFKPFGSGTFSLRNAEKQFVAEVDDIEPGTEWERIAKLCDFNPKVGRTNKDVSRMRSIILQLKQTPLKKD